MAGLQEYSPHNNPECLDSRLQESYPAIMIDPKFPFVASPLGSEVWLCELHSCARIRCSQAPARATALAICR